MSNNFNLIGMFPVPAIKISFKHHYKYNFQEVPKLDNRPEGWVIPVNSSFPGITDDDKLVSPQVRDNLKRDLCENIVEVFQQLNIPTNIEFLQFWYNIYHEHQGQEEHTHLPEVGTKLPFWSGIYYNKNASPTTFKRSDYAYRTHKFPGHDKSALAECLCESFSPYVKDGDILLFPPYLEHSVKTEPIHKDRMRLTFSFNIDLI